MLALLVAIAFSAKSPSAVFKLGKPPSAPCSTPGNAKHARTSASGTREKARHKGERQIEFRNDETSALLEIGGFIRRILSSPGHYLLVTANLERAEELPGKNCEPDSDAILMPAGFDKTAAICRANYRLTAASFPAPEMRCISLAA